MDQQFFIGTTAMSRYKSLYLRGRRQSLSRRKQKPHGEIKIDVPELGPLCGDVDQSRYRSVSKGFESRLLGLPAVCPAILEFREQRHTLRMEGQVESQGTAASAWWNQGSTRLTTND